MQARNKTPDRRPAGLARAASAALAIGLLGAFAAPQAPELPAEELAALERELAVPALEQLAEWCHEHKLYARRSEVYEALVRLAPDHSKAHRGLQHSLKNGQWNPPRKPYTPRDSNPDPDALAAFAERRAELLAPYCEAVMGTVAQLGLEPFEARAPIERVLLARPDDAAAHAFLGEVRVGERWMMEESALSLRRRAELDALWRAALERAASVLGEGEASSEERALGVAWSTVVESDRVRVLGTVPAAEARRAAALTHAARDLFAAFHPRAAGTRSTVYLLGSAGEKNAFLANYPGLADSDRALFATFTGASLPGGRAVAQWSESEDSRIDAVLRHAADSFFGNTFRIDLSRGWVYEGLGAYLTWRMTGTHRTWRIPASGRERAGGSGVTIESLFADGDLDWLTLARDRYCRSGRLALELERVLRAPREELGPADLLASFTLSAYLVEGRDDLRLLLERVQHLPDPQLAVTQALGTSVAELEWRVCRWLEQQDALEGLDAGVLVVREGAAAPPSSGPRTSSHGK